MDDVAVATRAIEGDQQAWAEIYDACADRLYDYCYAMVRNRQEAADVLHDAFVTAAAKIGQLRDPSKLRPWLYAICRTEALAAIRRRAREASAAEVPEMTDTSSGSDAHRKYTESELRELVVAAANGLEERDRAVLFLHLRGGLEGRELATALGVSAHHATVMLSRVREQVRRSLTALLVGRTGRGDCADLEALLRGWDGTLSPLIRKRVARHVDRCEVCGERRERMVSPLALLSAVPLVPAPEDLRQRTLDDIRLVSSHQRLGGYRQTRGRAAAAAAAIIAVLATGLALLLTPDEPDPTETRTAAGVRADATVTLTPSVVPSSVAASGPPSTTPSTPSSTSRAPVTTPRPSEPAGITPAARSTDAVPAPSPTTPARTEPAGPADRPQRPTPPAISNLSTDRASLSPGGSCSATSATATVTGKDVVRVVLVWQQGSGEPHSMDMSPAGGNEYAGRIGPVTGTDQVSWQVTATDAAGRTATSAVQTLPVRRTC